MTTAYVVLSHRDPDQVERLARAILRSSPESHVFVTHDARSSAPPCPVDAHMHVRPHGLATDWGSFDLVAASLDAFAWARETVDPALVVLVSGQDYPLRNLAGWEDEFLGSGGGWIGTARPLQYRPRWGRRQGQGDDDLTRYTYRWVRLPPARLLPRLPKPAQAAWARLRTAVFRRVEPALSWRSVTRGRGAYVGIRRLRTPFTAEQPCCKGAQMLAVDRAALDHLLDVAGRGTSLWRYFSRTIIPDEAMPQTVLSWRGAPRPGWVVSHSQWVPAEDATRTFTVDDLPHLLASGAAFARKVDGELSAALMDELDARTAWHGR